MVKRQRKYVPDSYEARFLVAIRASSTDEEFLAIINRLYENGFCDGHEEGLNDAKTWAKP